MIVYYSGTGNSKYCAEMIADKVQDDITDAGTMMHNHAVAEMISQKPWVFVSPTYAWQMPRIFEQFIRESSFQGSKDAYFVLTCGSEIGNAKAGIDKLCKDKHFNNLGVLPVVMPENYIAMFDVPDEKKAAEIINNSRSVVQEASVYIRKGRKLDSHPVTLMDRILSGPVNNAFYKWIVKADKFYATNQCTGCGACVRNCPLNNISLVDHKPSWGTECTHCMACICKCKQNAIEYGKKSKGKYRYQCEDYLG